MYGVDKSLFLKNLIHRSTASEALSPEKCILPEKMTEVSAQQASIAANALAPAAGNSTRRQAQGQMESLVSRMEAVAQRISARNMSASQHSVLVSRFNDLTRQVNLMDGIVAGEGQEVRGRRALRLGNGLNQTAGSTAARRRNIPRQAGSTRPAASGSKSGSFAGESGLGGARNTAITPQIVQDIRKDIQLQGLSVIGERRSAGVAVVFLA